MKVGQVMKQAVATCGPHDSLHEAAKIMWDSDCGCVPVTEHGRLTGMITDRDICMAAYLQGAPLTAMRVSSAMARNVYACRAEDSVAAAERVMRAKQVRRLPVVDADDRLIGILSVSDLALEVARENGHKKREVTAKEVSETLAAVSNPRPREISPADA